MTQEAPKPQPSPQGTAQNQQPETVQNTAQSQESVPEIKQFKAVSLRSAILREDDAGRMTLPHLEFVDTQHNSREYPSSTELFKAIIDNKANQHYRSDYIVYLTDGVVTNIVASPKTEHRIMNTEQQPETLPSIDVFKPPA
jgi:hypothetical protein